MENIIVPGRRTGLIYPEADLRDLLFEDYAKALAPPLPTIDWVSILKGQYGMLGNDTVGDCVQAGVYHEIQRATNYVGRPFTPTTAESIGLYSTLTGYNGNQSTDNGTDPVQLLKYWVKNDISGHSIVAWVNVNPLNVTQIKQSIGLFGNAFMAWSLPACAQNPGIGLNGYPCWNMQLPGITGDNGVSGSWGGHFTDSGQYGVDAQGNQGIQTVTWGQLYDVTWDFIAKYCIAIYVVVTQDWIEANGKSPSGFDLPTLLSDQKLVQAAPNSSLSVDMLRRGYR